MKNEFITEFKKPRALLKSDGPIIVVDDDRDYWEIIEICYKKSNCKNEIIFLDKGKALLNYMQEVLDGKKPFPELILLDINMPGLNGFETLQAIKNIEDFKEVPVILMFSSSDCPSDIKKANKLGAQGFWTKPIDIEENIKFFSNLRDQAS